jgi:hypothetical protein
MYNRNIEVGSTNHCCSGEVISITYSEPVFVALVIQHAKRARHIVNCGLSGPTIFCPHYLINGTTFGKKVLTIKRVFRFSLQLLSEIFLILRRPEDDIIINSYWSSCKVPLILERF